MKKYGDQVLGVETGDPREFKTWEEFWNAYVKQHELFPEKQPLPSNT